MTQYRTFDHWWRVRVKVYDEPNYTSNGIAFGSEEEADEYARDLALRWTAVEDWTVEPIAQANKTTVMDALEKLLLSESVKNWHWSFREDGTVELTVIFPREDNDA